MQKFGVLFDAARSKVRKEKGLPPVPSVYGQPSPPAVVKQVSPPHPPEPPVTVDHGDWQRTMGKLAQLEPVILWAEEQRPGMWRRFAELEHECRDAALNNHPDEYQRLKKSYLKSLGEVCELYFIGKLHYESMDILSIPLGFKEIRLHGHPAPPEIEGDRIPFFVREIPLLCCATPDEITQIVAVKETMPGALVI